MRLANDDNAHKRNELHLPRCVFSLWVDGEWLMPVLVGIGQRE